MWPFSRRTHVTTFTPVAEELKPRRRKFQLPKLGGTSQQRRHQCPTSTQEAVMDQAPAAMDQAPATVPDTDFDEEVDNFLMPERIENWPNFMLETLYRPYPFPGHVEDSDRNVVMNTSKAILFTLLPNEQPMPRQQQDPAEAGVAANEDAGDQPVRRSASARMLHAKERENWTVLVDRDEAAARRTRKAKRATRRRSTK